MPPRRPVGSPPAPGGADQDPGPGAEPEAPDVFLSYSRRDEAVARRLWDALELKGWRVWIDADDIPAAAEWREELSHGIEAAHTLVFAISPDSVRSRHCADELARAVELGKRIVPVLVRPADGVPEALAARQWVRLGASDDFSQSMAELDSALRTDLEWTREHRQWLGEALRWEEGGHDRSLLLRGRDLRAAEAWLARQAEHAEPRPTGLQVTFLAASRQAERRRLQRLVAGVCVALAVAVVLGVLALLQRNEANDQAAVARSRELATAATGQLGLDPERSLLLAIEAAEARPTAQAAAALRRALVASRVRAALPPRRDLDRIHLVRDLALLPDARVAVAAEDGSLRLWSPAVRGGQGVVELTIPAPSVDDPASLYPANHVQVAVSRGGRLVAAGDGFGRVRVWRPPKAEPVAQLAGEGKPVLALAFSDDARQLLIVRDGALTTWRWPAGPDSRTWRLGRATPFRAAFSGDGRRLVVVEGGGLRVWSTKGRPLSRLTLASPQALTAAVSADGGQILEGASDGAVRLWDTASGRSRLLRPGGGAEAWEAALSPDGRHAAVADLAEVIRVWDMRSTASPAVLRGEAATVTALALAPDGRRVVSGDADGWTRVWEPRGSSPLTLKGVAPPGPRVAPSGDGGYLVAAAPGGRARVWSLDGRHVARLAGVRGDEPLWLSRDARRAATVMGHQVLEWDLARSGEPRRLVRVGDMPLAALSASGARVVSGDAERVRTWRWPDGRVKVLQECLGCWTTALEPSPDGTLVAFARYNAKRSSLWLARPEAGGKPQRLGRFADSATDLAFDPGLTRLAMAGLEGTVRVWRLGPEAAPAVLPGGPDGGALAVAFSPDGAELASGGADGTVRLWRLDEGSAPAVLRGGHRGAVVGVTFSADGRRLISVGDDGRATVWECDACGTTREMIERARHRVTRNLDAEERATFLDEG